MVIGLQPLEFTDCILDSPDFRDNLQRHEKELEKTSQQIKRIIKEVKDLLTAAKDLSKAQRTLSKSLEEFNFECIGSTQTDDEQVIVNSLKQFGKLIAAIEDERDNMLARTHDQIVIPLETFRKEHINGVRESKKKFDKKTAKFCQAQERFLNMSSKKPDNAIQEAEASLGMSAVEYTQESLGYVLRIQEVKERIKFEFVETLLRFMSGWLVFYHYGHEINEDAKDYMKDLQHKVQKTRENFDETRAKASELKKKYMDSKMKTETEYTKQGYLFLMEKKAFTAIWVKYYCTYKKKDKEFSMIQFNQISGRPENTIENYNLISCVRRASEFEKRYCFDLVFDQKSGQTFTFQALSEEDRKAWLSAMDGKEPTPTIATTPGIVSIIINEDFQLDDIGFAFVRKCIEILETRGLEEEGLYRVGGVNTKISKLLTLGVDRKKTEKERLQFFHDESFSDLLESKTIASALKQFLRHLNEPLMTYRYHNGFIAAAKQETRMQRISDVHTLVHRLPKPNFDMLETVIRHLKAVSVKSHKNKMSVFNLGVVFGPTLLRPLEDTIASILDIKFNNVVIEILIENYDVIFRQPPGMVKPSDYLSGRDTRVEQTMGGGNHTNYRRTLNNSQPVVRVVAKSKQTDPVMSSSLQNIPNGLSIHTNSNNLQKNNNHHQIYDTKKSLNSMNSSTPSLSREHLSPREFHVGRTSGGLSDIGNLGEPLYHTSSGLASYNFIQGQRGNDRGTGMLANRSNADGILASRMGHTLTYSESNLMHQRDRGDSQSINDRINSTSSSNESVCSSSSRDLISTTSSTYNRYNSPPPQPPPLPAASLAPTKFNYKNNTYATTRESSETSPNFSPKKIQRGKPVGKSKFHAGRDNVRVRTLYACLAENEGELSFEPNQIITNVRPSNEPGWLEGSLAGKSGLIPENYVEVIP